MWGSRTLRFLKFDIYEIYAIWNLRNLKPSKPDIDEMWNLRNFKVMKFGTSETCDYFKLEIAISVLDAWFSALMAQLNAGRFKHFASHAFECVETGLQIARIWGKMHRPLCADPLPPPASKNVPLTMRAQSGTPPEMACSVWASKKLSGRGSGSSPPAALELSWSSLGALWELSGGSPGALLEELLGRGSESSPSQLNGLQKTTPENVALLYCFRRRKQISDSLLHGFRHT